MSQTINSLKSQIIAMQLRLEETPKEIGGAYNRKYYSLKAKIKNTQEILDKAKWKEFLAK